MGRGIRQIGRAGGALAGLAALAALVWPVGGAPPTVQMRQHESPYYIIHSDLPPDQVREASARMTAMAEEYYERTKGFTGVIRRKMPVYLFSREKDYLDAGGLKASAGVFTGRKLMALCDEQTRGYLWVTLQHEGFHQFTDAVIGGRMPVWADEGLAEYFGAAVFTGDGFISGVVPPEQAAAVQDMIRTRRIKPFESIMQLDAAEWNRQMADDTANYIQVWSMVHFLAHADEGKYRQAFEAFLKAVGRNRDWKDAWKRIFGTDVAAFQKRWADWWLAQPANPTAALYAKAAVATMTGYLARASSQGQRFESADRFFHAAEGKTLKSAPADWLPPSLLAESLPKAKRLGHWDLLNEPGKPLRLRCRAADGTTYLGQFTLKNGQVEKVTVSVQAATSQPDEPGLGLLKPGGRRS